VRNLTTSNTQWEFVLDGVHSGALAPKRASSAAPGGAALGIGDRAWKMVEAGLKAHYGILMGGGVVRTLRVMSSLVNSPAAADLW
jgi:hypothetical protein